MWPDGNAPKIGNYLILSAEDAANDTICPRLEAAGADLSRVHVLQAVVEQNGSRRCFSLQRDLEALGHARISIGGVNAIMIDPITAYMGHTDSHRTTDVRSTLEPLDKFAEAYRVAILAITHPPKASTGKAIHSFTGSLAFVAAARIAFIAVEESETGRSLLLPVKNNLGPLADGIGYRIEAGNTGKGISTSRLVWDTSPVIVTANEARGVPSSLCQSRMGPMAERDESHLDSSAGLASRPLQGRLGRFSSRRLISRPHLLRAASSVGGGASRQAARGCVSRWRVLIRRDQLLDELLEADRRIDHDRLHVGEVLQDADRGPRRRRCGTLPCRSRGTGASPGRSSAHRGCGC